MYWCEGDRSEQSHTYRVALTSCEAAMLKLFVEWLETWYDVKRGNLKIRLHLWPNINEEVAKKYWSASLNVPVENFTKSWIKPKGKGKRFHPYGVCRVSISSKALLHKILSEINEEFVVTAKAV